jgi:hypothetical protein
VRELTRSDNYAVVHDYEDAFLILPNGRRVPVGSFYGDPACAVIDRRERWCVVAGCGLLVYFLHEPFRPADVFPSGQYAWVRPSWGADPWWVEAVYQPSDDAVRFMVDPHGPHAGVYELRLPGLEVVPLVGVPRDAGPCAPTARGGVERFPDV